MALPSGIVDSFIYNGDGLRVQKQDSTGTTNHVWDGQNILLETNASNIIQVVYTLEPLLYGNLISQSRGGLASFFTFDALGSTAQLLNITGTITDSYVYDSFGNLISVSGVTTNAFRYVGQRGYYYDPDTEQVFLRLRYYQPSLGRFTSVDPSALSAAIATSAGTLRALYLYVENNAVNQIDPSGLEVLLWGTDACKAKVSQYYADVCKDFFANPKFLKNTDLSNCMFNFCNGDKGLNVYCPGETSPVLRHACNKGLGLNLRYVKIGSYVCARTLNGKNTKDKNPITVFCSDLDAADNGICGWKCTVFHELLHACQTARTETEARACTTALYPGAVCTTKLPDKKKPDPCACEGFNCC